MIDLWYVPTADVRDPALVARAVAVMSHEEREKQASFVFEKNRHEYLVTRAICRGVLARYAGVAPAALAFRRNEHGCPSLDPASDVRFNLTNTIHLVACVVARGREVGVDAEPLSRADEIVGIADTVFTAYERSELAALPIAGRRERAVRLWTLKEAYIKARGMGMSIPVEDFEIRFDAPRPSIGIVRDLGDDAMRWELSTFAIADHLVSTCVERLGERDLAVETHLARLADLL